MVYKFVIYGRFAGLNEYTSANRANPYKGAQMKKDAQRVAYLAITSQLRGLRIVKPVWMHYKFYEINKRRDHDNVESFAHKVIQDALVCAKVLKNDGWNEIKGNTNEFFVDSKHPRIEVELTEVNNG